MPSSSHSGDDNGTYFAPVGTQFEAARRSAIRHLHSYLDYKDDAESDLQIQRANVARDSLRASLEMMKYHLVDIARQERSRTSVWSLFLYALTFGFGQDMVQAVMHNIQVDSASRITQLRGHLLETTQQHVNTLALQSAQTFPALDAAMTHDGPQASLGAARRWNTPAEYLRALVERTLYGPAQQQAEQPSTPTLATTASSGANEVADLLSELTSQNASYTRWWYFRNALIAGFGLTLAFASYAATRNLAILWCQHSIRTLLRKLDRRELDKSKRHDLEGLNFTYLWWINMMLP